jgi:dCTP deaminase
MLKSDRWIRKTAREHDMINPFSEKQVREGVISWLIVIRIRPARGR